jgi:hypothetical protein
MPVFCLLHAVPQAPVLQTKLCRRIEVFVSYYRFYCELLESGTDVNATAETSCRLIQITMRGMWDIHNEKFHILGTQGNEILCCSFLDPNTVLSG